MSYNIRVGKGMDQVNNLQRIADVINRERPDFVALQEVDSVTVRTGGVNQIAELGRLTGMCASFAPAMTFSGGKYGVGILSREEPISVRRVPLPGREEPRVLLIAEFRDFIVASTHFSLTEADRITSAEILIAEVRHIEEARQIDKPVFIAGDLNAQPESATIRLLEQHFTLLSDKSAHTFPANNPDRCIDYIFGKFPTHHKFRITQKRVVPEAMASDHRPVMVELVLEAR
jgi:endonuclease/exonuclease/phosphatase family metal-dependent hydrolase